MNNIKIFFLVIWKIIQVTFTAPFSYSEIKINMSEDDRIAENLRSCLLEAARSRQTMETAVNALVRQHRTDQQRTMKVFVAFVEAMAKEGTDLRNESAVTLAKEIAALGLQKLSMPLI